MSEKTEDEEFTERMLYLLSKYGKETPFDTMERVETLQTVLDVFGIEVLPDGSSQFKPSKMDKHYKAQRDREMIELKAELAQLKQERDRLKAFLREFSEFVKTWNLVDSGSEDVIFSYAIKTQKLVDESGAGQN